MKNIYSIIPRKDLYRNIFIGISIYLGFSIFFDSPYIERIIDPQSIGWYFNYSKNIFHPWKAPDLRTEYYTESMLLPLIGKLTGASKNFVSYKILCATIQIAIIPTIACLSIKYFNSITKSYLFLLIFAFSFWHFGVTVVGLPDPITYMLLLPIAFVNTPLVLFLLALFASLSHFTIAALSIFGVCILTLTSSNKNKKYIVFSLILGVIAGRILLSIWYVALGLHPSRLEWVLKYGLNFFIDYHNSDGWLVPNWRFLTCYLALILYFLLSKKFAFAMSAIACFLMAYFAYFLSLDGIRIFSTVISGGYMILIVQFINSLPQIKFREKWIS